MRALTARRYAQPNAVPISMQQKLLLKGKQRNCYIGHISGDQAIGSFKLPWLMKCQYFHLGAIWDNLRTYTKWYQKWLVDSVRLFSMTMIGIDLGMGLKRYLKCIFCEDCPCKLFQSTKYMAFKCSPACSVWIKGDGLVFLCCWRIQYIY